MPPAIKLQHPMIDPIVLADLVEGDADALRGSARAEGQRFESADLEGADLTGAEIFECRFEGPNLHEAVLDGATVFDSEFVRLNAPVLRARRVRLRDVSIASSRVGSFEAYDASITSLVVADSKLGYVNLRGSKLIDVRFERCTIDELDLGGAKAQRVQFVDTFVETLDVTNANLAHVDLRGADLRRILGLEGLKGSTLSEQQILDLAADFAARLGIRVG